MPEFTGKTPALSGEMSGAAGKVPALPGNQQQNEAIVWNSGPALILAGPGSGKTFTTVERVRYLLTEYKVKPEQILVITFTKAAIKQMRDRFFTRMGTNAYPVTFGTFHAIFFTILKTSYFYNSKAILTDKEKREYLRTVLGSMEGDFCADADWEEGLLGEFGFIKNTGALGADFQSAYLTMQQFKQAFVRFQKLLAQNRKLDFDDFATQCLHLFRTRPDVLRLWQERFRYILVDEFQDINALQYAVVKLLAGTGPNLFVVGDDDQSIYGFRGANPGIMQQFLKDFPQAKKILLATNYRSAPGIVEWAGKLISRNRERMEKQIVSGKKSVREDAAQESAANVGAAVSKTVQAGVIGTAQGSVAFAGEVRMERAEVWHPLDADESVFLSGFADRELQNKAIAGQILQMLEQVRQSGKAVSVAVIFRTNTGVAPFADSLSRAGISFSFQEKVKNPYEHSVCRDLLAYLKFAKQERSRRNFLQIMNKPGRYLSRQALTEEMVSFPALLRFYREKPYMQTKLKRLQADISRIAGMDLYASVNYVRKGMGYDEWLQGSLRGTQLSESLEMADFFQKSVREFASLDALLAHMEEYEEALQAGGAVGAAGSVMRTDIGSAAAAESDPAVHLMTMHGSKGLEFEVVFLPDLNEGIVPHKKSMQGAAVEEERRMFYVGMTRAKEQLYLSWVSGTKEEPGFPSRFLGIWESGITE